MEANQIILLAIVILVSIIVVFGAYFLIVYLMNKKREKKIDTIFNPNNLVEEESLMNVMDEKRNLEYSDKKQDQERFVINQENIETIASPQAMTQEQKVNPFGVDMTMRTKDNTPVEPTNNDSGNKFIN